MRRILIFGSVVAITTLMLLWPMAFNRGPVLYPDTFTYVDNGADTVYHLRNLVFGDPEAFPATTDPASAAAGVPTVKLQTVSGRSLVYGLLGFLGWRVGGFGAAAVIQALWAAVALLLVLNRFDMTRARDQLAVAASLAVFTSLGFFAGTLLPDVFAGIGIAALGMLLAFSGRMGGIEKLFWVFSLAFAGVSHNAILAAVAATFALVTLVTWRQRGVGHALAAGGLALAVAGGTVSKPLTEMATGVEVISTPFLLARTIDDGPAARLLAEDCPKAGYASCRFVPYFPLTEGDVLWDRSGRQLPGQAPFIGWFKLPLEERAAVSAEANTIVLEALKRYPAEQVVASLGNFAEQLVFLDLQKFGWKLIYEQAASATGNSIFAAEGEKYKQTRIWAETFPLGLVSRVWLAVYLAAAGAIIALLAVASRRGISIDSASQTFVGTLITGVILNAAVCATFSATVGRYQSRLSWLVLLSAILIGHLVARARVKAPPEPRVSPI
jgi:hypothetical protein